MKIAHSLEIRTFINPEEDIELMKNQLLGLFDFDLEENKLKFVETKATGFDNKDMIILSIELKKDKFINPTFKKVLSQFSKKDIETLISTLLSRIDEEFNFYFRLNKFNFLDNKITLTDSGNCIHFKISIASYPKSLKNTKEIIKKYLEVFL